MDVTELKAKLDALPPAELERRLQALWQLMDAAQREEDQEIVYFKQFYEDDDDGQL